jgi:hypothetical protein
MNNISDRKLMLAIWQTASEIAFWVQPITESLFHSKGKENDSGSIVGKALDDVNADPALRQKIMKRNAWEPLTEENRSLVIQVFHILAKWRDEA